MAALKNFVVSDRQALHSVKQSPAHKKARAVAQAFG